MWERPLSKKDRKLLTESGEIEVPPDEVILAARVEDLVEKEAVLAEHLEAAFTTPHFHGYPAVLIRLDRLDADLLERDRHQCVAGGGAAEADRGARRRTRPTTRAGSPCWPVPDDGVSQQLRGRTASDVVLGGR